jgi:hypothetical protein
MNTRHVARSDPIYHATREGLARDVVVMLAGSAAAIGFCFILALLGISLEALDRWVLILSFPWFAMLYLLSRKIDLITETLSKTVLAAAAALVGSLSYACHFVLDAVKHVIDKLHMW